MMLNSVDLPQPDGPMTPTNSPGATVERDVVERGEDAVRRLEALDDVVDDENGLARLRLWRRCAARRPDGMC